MNLSQTIPIAVRALLRNKARSFLTTLGIIIGTASVISMVGVGEGAKARVESAFASMGTNLLIVLSGSTSSSGVMGGFGSMPTLTWDDLAAIRTEAPAVHIAAPAATTKATLQSEDANWSTSVVGSSTEYFEARAWKLAHGSLFSAADDVAGSKVVVLGQTVATSAADTSRAQQEMTAILRDEHRIPSNLEDDFSIRNLTEIAAAKQQGTKALTGLLAAIAVVSLVVGGIGIMNIMLVSVTERTREVGLRMALGAKPWHVLAQFLVEAITLSTMGGLLGIAIGTIVARLLASKLGWQFTTRFDMVALSFGFSALVGVVFGLYPARKAARLNPIDALRYE